MELLEAGVGGGVEGGDAEVSAEVEDVDGIEVAGDGDEGEGAGGFRQDHGSADVDAVHDDPDIGGSVMKGTADGGGGDDVLPSAEMVGGADGVDCGLIGDAVGVEAHGVNADALELADDGAVVGFRVGHERGGGAEHVAVEGEAGFGDGEGVELDERGRHPFKRDGGERSGGSGGGISVVGRLLRGEVGAEECGCEQGKSGGQFPAHVGLNADDGERLRGARREKGSVKFR